MARDLDIAIERLPKNFDQWQGLLGLIKNAFAYMDGVIDPPSSAHLLDVDSLREKAANEVCFIATSATELVGCVFMAERANAFHVGKLAVDERARGMGIGRALMSAAETQAIACGKPALELQTRIELTQNQTAFARMGFVEVRRTAHAGFDRPTSITYRKALA